MLGIVGYTLTAVGLLIVCIGLFGLVSKAMFDEWDNVLGTILTIVVGVIPLASGLAILLFVAPK